VLGSYAFGTLGGLVDIGVRFDDDGHLSVDREDLTSALVADPTAVRQLLGGDGVSEGLAARLAQAIDAVVKSNKIADPNDPTRFIETALLPARSVAIDSRVSALEQQIERLEARLEKREELLVAQFSRMEALVSQLRQQGSSLAGITTISNSNSSNQG
jgi:flagellar hook-associated protein 2